MATADTPTTEASEHGPEPHSSMHFCTHAGSSVAVDAGTGADVGGSQSVGAQAAIFEAQSHWSAACGKPHELLIMAHGGLSAKTLRTQSVASFCCSSVHGAAYEAAMSEAIKASDNILSVC